jgi:hypothetical protein
MERATDIWNGSMRKELPTPESLARALWNCSRLRHGNFTSTREFKGICEEILRAELESLRIRLNVESWRLRLAEAVKAGKELRTENERLKAENETAFQRGQASRKCECGEDSTGWTEFPCCNICGATVENNVDES